MPRGRDPNRRSEHLTVPLTLTEMESLETVAKAWGRSKTAFARELVLTGLESLPMNGPLRPIKES
jgi:hypothetical protein